MKKVFAVLAALFVSSSIYALPVYNPDQPAILRNGIFFNTDFCIGLEIGYRGDFVFDRKLTPRHNTGNVFEIAHDVCDYSSMTNAFQLTFNVANRCEIYGWVGANQSAIETQIDYVTTTGTVLGNTGFININGRTEKGFGWGIGARAVFWQCGNTAIGMDGQYSHSRGKFECLFFNGLTIENPAAGVLAPSSGEPWGPKQFNLRNREFQISLGVSHRICCLVPYLAVKYSNACSKFSGPDFETIAVISPALPTIIAPKVRFRNRNYVGLAAGVTVVDSGKWHLTVEGRFIDETALTVASDIRF